ncbi:MAG: HAMP domain-containing histidine kinase [Ktedonobacteraceae bacterium]|nr:HAMP domain-containing histidine kinase [Ktedonobacteraceae bacterium]
MSLRGLIRHIQQLFDCYIVQVSPGCSEPALRHPLLALLPSPSTPMPAITADRNGMPGQAVHILTDERLAATCDMAIQTGRLWRLEQLTLHDGHAGCAVAVPLRRPAGILGLLLLITDQSATLGPGEYMILEQLTALFSQRLEAYLLENSIINSVNEWIVQSEQEQRTGACGDGTKEPASFVSVVSHEMRVPLSAIKGYAALLQLYGNVNENESCKTGRELGQSLQEQEGMTPARRQQYLSAILQQVDHLETLVNDLLDIERIRTGRITLRSTNVDLLPLCYDAARLIQEREDRQRPGYYTIRCLAKREPPPVRADAARVRQILINLLENAVKYSPAGGVIEILVDYACPHHIPLPPTSPSQHDTARCSSQKGYALPPTSVCYASITICDEGVGIPAHLQPFLFQAFTRAEHASLRDVPGTGLGLYIARELVEAQSGKITLSNREKQGTCVTFTLPLACSIADYQMNRSRQTTCEIRHSLL